MKSSLSRILLRFSPHLPGDGFWPPTRATAVRQARARGLIWKTLAGFVKNTQPLVWKRFEKQCGGDAVQKFYRCFEDAVQKNGLIHVLRHGFIIAAWNFGSAGFRPESSLNELAVERYGRMCASASGSGIIPRRTGNSVDMMLAINGIPVVALELKNQLTGQNVDDARRQWNVRPGSRRTGVPPEQPRARVFCRGSLSGHDDYLACRRTDCVSAVQSGSAGPGKDGGAGNPPSADGSYVTSYLWKDVLQKDSLLDILQKFIPFRGENGKAEACRGQRTHRHQAKGCFSAVSSAGRRA